MKGNELLSKGGISQRINSALPTNGRIIAYRRSSVEWQWLLLGDFWLHCHWKSLRINSFQFRKVLLSKNENAYTVEGSVYSTAPWLIPSSLVMELKKGLWVRCESRMGGMTTISGEGHSGWWKLLCRRASRVWTPFVVMDAAVAIWSYLLNGWGLV